MKTRFLLITCLLYSAFSNAQNEVTKLQKQLSHTTDSTRYTDMLNRLAMLYSEINADSTFYYASAARDIAQRLQYEKGAADAANNLGILHDLKGNTQQALRYYDEAYNRYSGMGDLSNMIQTTTNIAIVFDEMDKTSKILSSFKKVFALAKNLRQDSIMSLVYSNYVLCFYGDMPADSVQFYIRKSREIATRYKDYRMVLFINQLNADIIAASHPQKAITILQITLQAALANRLYYTAADVLLDLGNITADSSKAANYYLQSLSLSREKGFTASVRYAYEKLYDFYQDKGDDAASLLYGQKLLNFYDQQQNVDNSYGIDYMDYALKNRELADSVTQLKSQQRLFILSVIICILCISFIIMLWRYARKLKKTGSALKLQFAQAESTAASLDTLNKDYARVIKVVAHDLRNPISTINMISELINPQMPHEEVQELTGIIKSLSKNCFDLIDQLLHADLNEDQQMVKSKLDLNSLLLQCVRMLNFKAKEKKQQIVFSNQNEFIVFADPDKLMRVITNLVMNAIKFSPEESIINIKTFLNSKNAIIAIIDQGIGIPPGLQNKVFDPFTSAKRPGTKGETTFGLGLYISKRIVEAHGGIIWFNSMPGNGTAFYMQLPLMEKEAENIALEEVESLQRN